MTGSLFQTLFNLVDTFYAGKISPEALAALAKSFPLYFIIISAEWNSCEVQTLISNSLGQRNIVLANIYIHHSLIYAFILSFL